MKRCLPFLTDTAKSLEGAGADFLVMPCNSLHLFIEDTRRAVNIRAVNIPIISIVEKTIEFLTCTAY